MGQKNELRVSTMDKYIYPCLHTCSNITEESGKKKNQQQTWLLYTYFVDFLKWSFKQEDATQTKTVHTAQILKICFQKICVFHFLFFIHGSAEIQALNLLTSGRRVLPKFSYHIREVCCDKT